MEERSLKIYAQEKTFFTKITNTITKLLIPTRVGINNMMIAMKRSNVLKAYESYIEAGKLEDPEKQKSALKKYEDTFALYLEALDKYVMDSIYKKVKNETATEFEKNALSNYYLVIHLKETEYIEYKSRKQKFLLELDFEDLKAADKQKILERYYPFYISKMDSLYKGILKNYSIKLADNLTPKNKQEIYEKIFALLQEYIVAILPIKMKTENKETYQNILEEYEKLENYQVGKLDQRDYIEKNMLLLGISRNLFTHSLPLVVAEQCYIKLLKDTRSLIVDTKILKKQERAYALLLDLIEDYNTKLLSTKIYWDKPEQRAWYKKFWEEFQKINEMKETNPEAYQKQKEILFVRSDLKMVYQNENRYYKIIQFYKKKLVELGAMRNLRNSYESIGNYTKKRVKAS